ncbi:MAG: flagellar brake protein [Gammaproteobacteria bacterium]
MKLAFAGTRQRRAEALPANAVAAHDPRHQVLLKLFTRHCLLDLRWADGSAAQSAIIELVPEDGYLVLDRPKPVPAHELVDAQAAIAVRALLDGREVAFETRIVQRGGAGDSDFYKALYPDDVEFPQRRREYRAAVPLDKALAVRAEDEAGMRLVGELRDLSPGGFSARITYDGFERLERALGWRARCVIDTGDEPLEAIIEICHVVPPKGRSLGRIGACFVDLDARAERRIERYVAALDRAQVRLR